ncbi:SapC family protein [Rhodospirillaceae bacterium]|nr:SapC family protein [Rhodospirillaceae bacterium]
MAWIPVSKERHGGLGLRRLTDYFYAKSSRLIPISVMEISSCTTTMPIVFIMESGVIKLMGVVGFGGNKNLMVGGDGQWQGGYIPASIRSYPFNLALSKTGDAILVMLDDKDLLVDKDKGKAFFDESGEATKFCNDIVSFLQKIEVSNRITLEACRIIAELDLLEPWSDDFSTDNNDNSLNSFLRVNEEKFRKLGDDDIVRLNKSYGLHIIFGHLFSSTNTGRLVATNRFRNKENENLRELGDSIFNDGNPLELKF